jgi:outer membrane protein assembly factor BamB
MLGATPSAYYNRIYALNQDGSLKWTYQNETQPWTIGYPTFNNIHSSPAIGTDGSIYVGSYDGHVYALNPDGSLKWSYKTNDAIISSPAIGSDGTIYIGSYDGHVYALDTDGSLKWRHQTGDMIASSPAIGDHGTIYVGSHDGRVFAFGIIDKTPPEIICPADMFLSATGSWAPVTYSAIVNDNIDFDSMIVYEPAQGSDFPVGEKEVIVTATDFSGNSSTCTFKVTVEDTNPEPSRLANTAWPCWGHDSRHTGLSPYIGASASALQWTYQMDEDNGKSPPAIGADGIIYIESSEGSVYALNPDGSLRWRYKTEDSVLYSAAIAADGTIYIGGSEGNVYALNPDGGLKWSCKTGDKVGQSPAIASDGIVYVGSFDKKIYALNPDGSLKWDYQTRTGKKGEKGDGSIFFQKSEDKFSLGLLDHKNAGARPLPLLTPDSSSFRYLND